MGQELDSIGIEFEGGIYETALKKLMLWGIANGFKDKLEWDNDGSVRVAEDSGLYSREEDEESNSAWIHDVEIRVWNYTKNIEDLKSFVDKLWKAGFLTNDTCGMHMHTKFKDMKYMEAVFAYPETINRFQEDYKKHYEGNDKYLNRFGANMNGNTYSAGTVETEDSVINALRGGETRYKAVNLLSLRDSQNTIEYRIFPHQDSAKECKETIDWFIKEINTLSDYYSTGGRTSYTAPPFLVRGRHKQVINGDIPYKDENKSFEDEIRYYTKATTEKLEPITIDYVGEIHV